MRIVITGSGGFVGANLRVRLREICYDDVVEITRATTADEFAAAMASADFVFHLAGTNRPATDVDFGPGNVGVTAKLCQALANHYRPVPILFTSSTQATMPNAYGASKLAAENILRQYNRDTGSPVHLMRLTNVFGKWARPNYNSAVATFCHNIARGLPIAVREPSAPLRLIYIDDVVDACIRVLKEGHPAGELVEVGPVYETTVGEVADTIRSFIASRSSLLIPPVGSGLVRLLYSTYVSYLPPPLFTYRVPIYSDPRGTFAEIFKTPDCGQFSYFTAHPGITRGGHYHHTKTEKFVVIRGTARFRFRHIATGEYYELDVRGGEGQNVETVPGWAHDVTNIGDDELIVMLWANEIFDRAKPDTIAMEVLE